MAITFTKTVTPTDSSGVASSGGISTYSTQSIGTASDDRIVLLGVVTEAAGASITSATIDYGSGDIAMKAGSEGTTGNTFVRWFYLAVPTGTTATFKITYGAAVTGGAGGTNNITVYAVTGAHNVFSTGQVGDTDGDPISSGSVTVPTSGGAIFLYNGATDSTARTWTGATEDIDADAGAMRLSTGTATATVTATVSGANTEDTALSWLTFLPTAVNFGDIIGISSASGINIPDPATPTDLPINVAVGDLIFVAIGEITAQTAVDCTDNLGNSYTTLTSGTTGALASVKAYFSKATVAGYCTPTVDTTASADDYGVICVVYKGPFTSSPLDINPAVLGDAAEPYTATATGTLSQADELIVGYFSCVSSETFDTPAPSARLDKQVGNSINCPVAVTSLVVAATTSVSMALSGSIGTRATACGVATFKKGTNTTDGDAAAAGTSTVSGTSAAAAASTAAAAGTATASGVGAATAAEVASSAGTSTVSGVSAATAAEVANAAGTSTADAVGINVFNVTASAAGTSTVAAISSATAAEVADSAGVATVSGVSAATAAEVAAAAGTSTVLGVSAATSAQVANAAGTSTADAVGEDLGAGGTTDAVAAASGTSTVSGVSAVAATATAASAGTSTADATSTATAASVGNADGTSTADAVGASTGGEEATPAPGPNLMPGGIALSRKKFEEIWAAMIAAQERARELESRKAQKKLLQVGDVAQFVVNLEIAAVDAEFRAHALKLQNALEAASRASTTAQLISKINSAAKEVQALKQQMDEEEMLALLLAA